MWECTSTTTSTTTTQVLLPPTLGLPAAFETLSDQMELTLASTTGASLRQLLAPYLSGSAQKVDETRQAVATMGQAGAPRSDTVWVGPDSAKDVFMAFGNAATVTNTHTDEVIEEVFQTRQVLDPAAAAFLLGDIYAAVPASILDSDFTFITSLLGHASASAASFESFAPEPLGFAGPQLRSPAIDATAFAASGAPGTFFAPGWTTWIDGSYGTSGFAATADRFALSFSTADTTIGADYADGPWRAGGSVGFARTSLAQPETGDSGAVTSLRAGAYAGFDGGDWSLTGGLAAGYHWAQMERLSGLPTPATSAFSATSLSAAVEASRRFTLLGASFEPLAGATLSLVNTGGFTESGTNLLDLAGQPATTKTVKLHVGGRASSRLAFGDDIVVVPEAHVRVAYDVLADAPTVTTAFVSDPTGTQTTISGLQPGRLAAQLGAGVGVDIGRRWRIALAYQTEFRGGRDLAHKLSGSIRGTW